MKRLFPILLAVALVLPGLATAATRPARTSPPVPLLWEVRGEGNARLLLLGSFHLLKDGDYPLSADVERAFAQADRLVFELGPEDMASPALAGQLLQAARRRDGTRLQQELPAVQWQKLQDWSARHAMPVASLQGLQAWFVALNINLQELAGLGMRADLGLDRHLMERARAAGKTGLGLEGAHEQIALFAALDAGIQRQMLTEALEEADQGGAQMQQLYAAWRAGDDVLLWRKTGLDMRQRTPLLYEVVNAQRNRSWLGQLPQWLKAGQGTTLVVVGAMHLLGDDGLVAQLQAQGKTVRRLCTVSGCRAVMRTSGAHH